MIEGVIGVFAILFIFAIISFLILIVYKRGERIRLWVHPIPCFPRMKSTIPLNVKITKHVIQTLSPNLIKIFDETMKSLKGEAEKELKESWTKIKANPQNFTIWCMRFKKDWVISGEKGKLVFVFSLFSKEEMIRNHYRKKEIQGILLHPPFHVHHPIPKKDWIKLRIAEAKANKRPITPELRKKIEKSYRLAPKESWICLILRPTALSVTKEAQLVERSKVWEHLFRISTNALRTFSTKLAEYEVYVHTVANILEVKKNMETVIHRLEDDKGTNARDIQQLRDQVKMLTVPLRISPDREPFPQSIPRTVKEQNQSVKDLKRKVNDMDYTEAFLAVMAVLGLIFLIVGFFVTVASVTLWPVLALGLVMSFCGVGLYIWKKRNDPNTEKKVNPEKGILENATI